MVMDNSKSDELYADELAQASALLHEGNSAEAFKKFTELAARGATGALVNLGWMYQTGNGVTADKVKARELYERAAAAGSVVANHYLGRLLHAAGESGKALERFQRSAAQRYAPSSYWAATMYLRGEGTAVDLRKAEELMSAAASGGHLFAQRDLAIAKMSGRFGHRALVGGVIDWVRAVVGGLRESARNPNSERLM